jgi:uncharacterized protein YdhG (YjbR/CyaY superfamily)
MPEKKRAATRPAKPQEGFTSEEVAAMKDRVRELRARSRGGKVNGEQEVLAKIAAMPASERAIAERLHELIKSTAPELSSKTWYGMPAYVKDDEVICFFRNAGKFKTRYSTLGFSDSAKLDDGHMWPTDFALTELTHAEEERIADLLKRALS